MKDKSNNSKRFWRSLKMKFISYWAVVVFFLIPPNGGIKTVLLKTAGFIIICIIEAKRETYKNLSKSNNE